MLSRIEDARAAALAAACEIRLFDVATSMTAGSVTNTGIISMPTERKYLPTFAELCDRLSIVLLKAVLSWTPRYTIPSAR